MREARKAAARAPPTPAPGASEPTTTRTTKTRATRTRSRPQPTPPLCLPVPLQWQHQRRPAVPGARHQPRQRGKRQAASALRGGARHGHATNVPCQRGAGEGGHRRSAATMQWCGGGRSTSVHGGGARHATGAERCGCQPMPLRACRWWCAGPRAVSTGCSGRRPTRQRWPRQRHGRACTAPSRRLATACSPATTRPTHATNEPTPGRRVRDAVAVGARATSISNTAHRQPPAPPHLLFCCPSAATWRRHARWTRCRRRRWWTRQCGTQWTSATGTTLASGSRWARQCTAHVQGLRTARTAARTSRMSSALR